MKEDLWYGLPSISLTLREIHVLSSLFFFLFFSLFPGLAMSSAPTSNAQLTLDRIHADPALAGPAMRNLQVSPDGVRVTFLRGRPDDQFQLDLWQYHLQDKRLRLLVDSTALAPEESISDQEKARRERERTANLRGILHYSWAPNGQQLLVPLAGKLYLVDLVDLADRNGPAPARPCR